MSAATAADSEIRFVDLPFQMEWADCNKTEILGRISKQLVELRSTAKLKVVLPTGEETPVNTVDVKADQRLARMEDGVVFVGVRTNDHMTTQRDEWKCVGRAISDILTVNYNELKIPYTQKTAGRLVFFKMVLPGTVSMDAATRWEDGCATVEEELAAALPSTAKAPSSPLPSLQTVLGVYQSIDSNDVTAIKSLGKTLDRFHLDRAVCCSEPETIKAVWMAILPHPDPKVSKMTLSRCLGKAPTRKVIDALVELGADVEFAAACTIHTVAAAEYLIAEKKRFKPNDVNLITRDLSDDLLHWLLRHGFKLNFVHPSYGQSPLMFSATRCIYKIEHVRLFLSMGADPNLRDRDTRSILMKVDQDRLDVIDLMLETMDPARNPANEVEMAGKPETAQRMRNHARWATATATAMPASTTKPA